MRFWTEEKVKLLKELDAAGMSAGEIAKAIGAPSRSSVLGKLFRLANPNYDAAKNAARKKGMSQHTRPGKPYAPALPEPLDEDIGEEDIVTPFAPNRSIGIPDAVLNRHPRQCRYSIGDPGQPDYHFCDKERAGASSYCPEHHAICKTKLFKPEPKPEAQSPVEFRRWG